MITLSSDFGSPYPAAMKGVISQKTDARLVDVSHDFPRGDVRTAAFWLREILPYYPPASHLVVVDPGVGTDRRAVVVRAGEHALVGPDNGVLFPAARALAASTDGSLEAFEIDDSATETDLLEISHVPETAAENRPNGRSTTFHGRDVFAPAAAAVHETPLDQLGSLEGLSPIGALDSLVEETLPTAALEADSDRARGEVLVVDDFGNVITNVPGTFLADRESVVANGSRVPVGATFASVPVGERLATVGSHGYVELDVNDGRGDEAFSLEPGDEVVLEP
ncbi:S-adenosylmethionine hydroxide adenosyltransferase [Halostagnicola larsenii XH-48]|uniref:S-adenosylmethionine hydroxide adenosyltransferase n=1 Tax=Halostagnicola larsenii XH-48 TaxID=797299 RepID=W0JNN3_9EURY|nr:SAM-dependent chlorinase/fluorinase [Halostagnicola larsenii]AHF98769.1 S-adenosylmethionine hydroxide adenosyltransferase [Halostagnicola larsenii XH-48]